jgi:hypothetical protein
MRLRLHATSTTTLPISLRSNLIGSAGVYLGQDGQDDLFAALDARSVVVFIHPAELPGPGVDGIPPFAVDFLLDTTRAAYLLVRKRDLPQVPTYQIHSQPRRRIRPLRLAPNGAPSWATPDAA